MRDDNVTVMDDDELYVYLKSPRTDYPYFQPEASADGLDRGEGWLVNEQGERDPTMTGPIYVFARDLRGPVDLATPTGGDKREAAETPSTSATPSSSTPAPAASADAVVRTLGG